MCTGQKSADCVTEIAASSFHCGQKVEHQRGNIRQDQNQRTDEMPQRSFTGKCTLGPRKIVCCFTFLVLHLEAKA